MTLSLNAARPDWLSAIVKSLSCVGIKPQKPRHALDQSVFVPVHLPVGSRNLHHLVKKQLPLRFIKRQKMGQRPLFHRLAVFRFEKRMKRRHVGRTNAEMAFADPSECIQFRLPDNPVRQHHPEQHQHLSHQHRTGGNLLDGWQAIGPSAEYFRDAIKKHSCSIPDLQSACRIKGYMARLGKAVIAVQ